MSRLTWRTAPLLRLAHFPVADPDPRPWAATLPKLVPPMTHAPHPTEADAPLEVSLVAPAHNEEENIERLVEESHRALASLPLPPGGFEFIIVDDGSTDATRARILDLMATRPWLRCIGMTQTPPGKGNGQSAAFHAGFRAARGRLIATLDADLQNDPADLLPMLQLLRSENADMVQ